MAELGTWLGSLDACIAGGDEKGIEGNLSQSDDYPEFFQQGQLPNKVGTAGLEFRGCGLIGWGGAAGGGADKNVMGLQAVIAMVRRGLVGEAELM